MPGFTLLEMTQSILNSMTGDEINSISDTTESLQVANIIKQAYLFVQTKADLPEHATVFELNSSGDSAKPTLMTIPDDVASFTEIYYDNKEPATDTYSDYVEVTYLPFDTFLERQRGLLNDTSGVGEMVMTGNGESHNIMYKTDAFPLYYTTFDDSQLIFDSYLATEDSTLQKSKTMCHGVIIPGFTLSDSYTFDIDSNQQMILLNEAKSLCFSELKQLSHPKAERTARQLWIKAQSEKRKSPYGQKGNYSRLNSFARKTF